MREAIPLSSLLVSLITLSTDQEAGKETGTSLTLHTWIKEAQLLISTIRCQLKILRAPFQESWLGSKSPQATKTPTPTRL